MKRGILFNRRIIHSSSGRKKVLSYQLEDAQEILGVNSKVELAEASKVLRERKIKIDGSRCYFIGSDDNLCGRRC